MAGPGKSHVWLGATCRLIGTIPTVPFVLIDEAHAGAQLHAAFAAIPLTRRGLGEGHPQHVLNQRQEQGRMRQEHGSFLADVPFKDLFSCQRLTPVFL